MAVRRSPTYTAVVGDVATCSVSLNKVDAEEVIEDAIVEGEVEEESGEEGTGVIEVVSTTGVGVVSTFPVSEGGLGPSIMI